MIETPVGPHTSDELVLLADHNLDIAAAYDEVADCAEDAHCREMADALAQWRRVRARLFKEAAAAADRAEEEYASRMALDQ